MKKLTLPALLLLLMTTFSSCDLAAGIFKTGFNLGIIVVIVVVVLVIWLVAKMFGGRS